MPANNRVHSSAALQTHGIWQSAIGYDPYAPENNKQQPGRPSSSVSANAAAAAANDANAAAAAAAASGSGSGDGNAYTSFQGLLALARITGSNSDETRGACKKRLHRPSSRRSRRRLQPAGMQMRFPMRRKRRTRTAIPLIPT
jgi:hypothetical protein